MPRYIDADKLIAHLKDEIKECEIPFGSRANGKGIAYGTALGLKSAISFAETLSTTDVVPKSEVVNIFDELRKEAREIADRYEKLANETSDYDYARIEYRGCQMGALLVLFKIAELKKKYTEGEQ